VFQGENTSSKLMAQPQSPRFLILHHIRRFPVSKMKVSRFSPLIEIVNSGAIHASCVRLRRSAFAEGNQWIVAGLAADVLFIDEVGNIKPGGSGWDACPVPLIFGVQEGAQKGGGGLADDTYKSWY
jgi:hypothetical protein